MGVLKSLKSPLVLALLVGLLFYALPVGIPSVVKTSIRSIALCNSPLAMIIIGIYLAQAKFSDIFTLPDAWTVSLVRLIVIPLATLFVLRIIPNLSEEIRLSLLILASAPVGINIAMYAQRAGGDHLKATILICHSTIFSILTLPLLILLSNTVDRLLS